MSIGTSSGFLSSSSSSPSSSSSWAKSSMISLALATLALAVAVVVAFKPLVLTSSSSKQGGKATDTTGSISATAHDNNQNDRSNIGREQQSELVHQIQQQKISIACLGNSIQYYNDCPRLLERILAESGFNDVKQDSCLRGGASIVSLWKKGNGMQNKFATPNALLPAENASQDRNNTDNNLQSYDIGAPTVQALLENQSFDFVIINDHTQSPARQETRDQTLQALQQEYGPLLLQSKIVPIFIQTAAYRVPDIRGTTDLGSFDTYQALLEEGYEMYKQQMEAFWKKHDNSQLLSTHIAPVGLAYKELYHSNRELWKQLYHTDDFHPSPHGTLLQAFVLFLTLVHALLGDTVKPSDIAQVLLPSTYETSWWDSSRRMQPPDEDPLPLPTKQEAEALRQTAIQVCQDSWNRQKQ